MGTEIRCRMINSMTSFARFVKMIGNSCFRPSSKPLKSQNPLLRLSLCPGFPIGSPLPSNGILVPVFLRPHTQRSALALAVSPKRCCEAAEEETPKALTGCRPRALFVDGQDDPSPWALKLLQFRFRKSFLLPKLLKSASGFAWSLLSRLWPNLWIIVRFLLAELWLN